MNLIQTLEREQMDASRGGRKLPVFRPGDTLKVNVKVVDVSFDEKTKQPKTRERLRSRPLNLVKRPPLAIHAVAEFDAVRFCRFQIGRDVPCIIQVGLVIFRQPGEESHHQFFHH